MIIKVLLFGHYRSFVPEGVLQMELPEDATVAEAAALLAQRDPRLAELLARTRVGVNAEFAPADTVLRDGDEVAFLPPMSGG